MARTPTNGSPIVSGDSGDDKPAADRPAMRLYLPDHGASGGVGRWQDVVRYDGGEERAFDRQVSIWTPEEWAALPDPRPAALRASNGCYFLPRPIV